MLASENALYNYWGLKGNYLAVHGCAQGTHLKHHWSLSLDLHSHHSAKILDLIEVHG